jgi:transcriptional regulator with XRE-family HTH domain
VTHFVDAHVGERLRQRRLLLGLNQMQLAERIGVSFQQLQKYELGKNRVSASRLWEIAQALRVPVGFFFEGLSSSEVQEWTSDLHDALNAKDIVTLARAYGSMPEHHRLSMLNLAKSLAKHSVD